METATKQRRIALGLTLAQVGEACSCAAGQVSCWERFETEPRGISRVRYAAALQMTVEELGALFWRHAADLATAAETDSERNAEGEPSAAAVAAPVRVGDSSEADPRPEHDEKE